MIVAAGFLAFLCVLIVATIGASIAIMIGPAGH
jgi:hypothetical protein